MAILNVVKLSDLEGAKRMDAEYYQPIYVEERKRLEGIDAIKLGAIAFITDGQHGYHIVDPDSDIKHITAKCVQDGLIVDDEADRLSIITHNKNLRSALAREDVLITTAGTVGQCGIVTENILPANIDQDLARVNILDKKLSPYYVMAFILSEYGQLQIRFNITGQDRQHLALEKIHKLIIPKLGKFKDVESLVKESLELRLKAKSFFAKAENLLLEELRLKDFKPKYELSYSANLSKAFGVHRVDAEYFQPAYHNLVEHLKAKVELRPLRKFFLDFQKGIEVGSENYQEEGKLFIRVSNLSVYGFVGRDQQYISEELHQQLKDVYEPKVGDFLLTKDATPGIAYVVKEPIEGIISSGILKFSINESEINKEYLALCINSIIGRMQIERDGGGSVITHWRPEQIKRLQIPILPDKTQTKIGSLVQQSHEARGRAKELLEKAIRKVEEAIEKEIKK